VLTSKDHNGPKMGVLGSIIQLLQQSEEHRDHLQHPPQTGQASDNLTELSVQMTTLGDVTISVERARSICYSVSVSLRVSGQIATLPEPASILNTLCAHHVLEILEYLTVPVPRSHMISCKRSKRLFWSGSDTATLGPLYTCARRGQRDQKSPFRNGFKE